MFRAEQDSAPSAEGSAKRHVRASIKRGSVSGRSKRRKLGFHHFAHWSARASGHQLAFGLAVTVVLMWLITGPFFQFSDTWQLVINTATTIITFLMVFLIQNTQNRDSDALQLKLDELIRATKSAHNALLEIEQLSEVELKDLRARYAKLAETARAQVRTGKSDLGSPDIKKP
jgi:low affinity Fe/Cu permease